VFGISIDEADDETILTYHSILAEDVTHWRYDLYDCMYGVESLSDTTLCPP
jgi:hypothetical protein